MFGNKISLDLCINDFIREKQVLKFRIISINVLAQQAVVKLIIYFIFHNYIKVLIFLLKIMEFIDNFIVF